MNATVTFSEKEMMQDLLATEKQVISAYSVGITESSCQNLRSTLLNNFKNSEEIQFKVFDTMKQKGWYTTKDAPDNDVQQVKNDANNLSREIH